MEFSDLYKMLVGEMSAPRIDYTNPSISANRKWKECEKDSKKIKGFISEQFGQVDVFLCSENDINKFFFFVGDNLWGTVETRLLKEGGIEMREIITFQTPKEFPQSGFQLGAIYLNKIKGKCEFTHWENYD